jgi:coenzyme F420 biosynthesis associated uncharacterized protein
MQVISMSSNTSPGSNNRNVKVAAAGAVAGAAFSVWINRRNRNNPNPVTVDGVIDWAKARETATRMNKGDALTANERERLNAYYFDLVEKCVPIVSEYTGTSLPNGAPQTFAFDRVDWINANLESFQRMFKAIDELNAKKTLSGFSRIWHGLNQKVLSYQIGVVLGYMGRRVLGQYDLALLGREQVTETGKLYYVEPNIRGIEAKLGLPREDFRMWLALHETTHAFEFEGHPWVRDHFNGLLDRYMNFVNEDAEQLKQGLKGLKVFAERVRNRESGGNGWIEAFMNKDQRALFNEMQAMMCVVEGYSNHVMNAVGKTLLPTYDVIARKFEERQAQRTQAEQLFAKLTGLDVKMEQYRAGEKFIDAIVAARGQDAARLVWHAAEFLPNMKEIRDPNLWLERTANVTPTAQLA